MKRTQMYLDKKSFSILENRSKITNKSIKKLMSESINQHYVKHYPMLKKDDFDT